MILGKQHPIFVCEYPHSLLYLLKGLQQVSITNNQVSALHISGGFPIKKMPTHHPKTNPVLHGFLRPTTSLRPMPSVECPDLARSLLSESPPLGPAEGPAARRVRCAQPVSWETDSFPWQRTTWGSSSIPLIIVIMAIIMVILLLLLLLLLLLIIVKLKHINNK